MIIGWPEGILLALVFLTFAGHLAKHGQPKEGAYNAGFKLIDTALLIGLLYWGGFFA